jgi:hypothetical protein
VTRFIFALIILGLSASKFTFILWLIWRVSMPRATVLKTTERRDLTTVEGGYIELRRLSYGEKLAKDAEAMKMRFGMDAATSNFDAEMSLINEFATVLEFQKCIVGHNLTKPGKNEGDDDVPLDFSKPADVRELDPRIGDEISTLIGELNDFEKAATASIRDASGK